MPRTIALIAAIAFSAAAATQAQAQQQAQQQPAQQQTTTQAEEPVVGDRKLSDWIADLKAPAPYSRNRAAYEISMLGPAAAPAVPALVEALKDDDATVRYPVTVALREIGPAAKEAVPALKKVYEEDLNDEVASSARRAIKAIAPSEVPHD